MILQTERLYLRELTQEDFQNLCSILQDSDVMYAYEHAFSHQEVQDWLDRQINRYKDNGFGLWAVLQKETNIFLGQCGLTMQECAGKQVVEIGYLFQKAHWHQGYAIEAAKACKEYAFQTLKVKEVYSIIRDTNISSKNVAVKNGMVKTGSFIKHYYNIDMIHDIFKISQET